MVTFEITRNMILAPEKTDGYAIPDAAKFDRRAAQLPGSQPEDREPQREDSRPGPADRRDKQRRGTTWRRSTIGSGRTLSIKTGPLKGALAALRDGTATARTSPRCSSPSAAPPTFPPASVWVPGHCYAEFYLVDGKGAGALVSLPAAGSRAFGCIPELRPILQKGDNYRPLYKTRDHQRYLAEYLNGKPTPGGGKPQVRFVREAVN